MTNNKAEKTLLANMHWSVWGSNRNIPVTTHKVKGSAKQIVAQLIMSCCPNSRVLDIGSGNDKLINALATEGFSGIYETLDTDPNVKAMYRNIDEVKGLYNVVTMLEVIEHLRLTETIEYLNQLRTIMRVDGILIISTPDPSHPTWFFEDISHIQHYPYRDFVAILYRNGFQTLDVYRIMESVPLEKYPPLIRDLVAVLGRAFRNLLTRLTAVNFETKTNIFVITPRAVEGETTTSKWQKQ